MISYLSEVQPRVRAVPYWLIALGVAVLIGVVVFASVVWVYGRDLPDYAHLKTYRPQVTTRIYAGDGGFLSEYAYEKRTFVAIDEVPEVVIDAFIAAEDQNFWSHPGIDVFSMMRAALSNVRNYGTNKRPQGGSTITQQVAKNFLLSNEVSLERKIKEAILAMRIEEALPKKRILELYLNEIYLGLSAYGVASAADIYFGKTLDALTLEEAAFLAGLPKAPSTYHPRKHPVRALDRRNWVLERMVTDGSISEQEGALAAKQPLTSLPKKGKEVVSSFYFSEDVRQELVRRYDEATLYASGLSVYTSLNPRLQRIANDALQEGLERFDRKLGWRGAHAHLATLSDWQQQLAQIDQPIGTEKWSMAVVLDAQQYTARIGLSDGTMGEIFVDDIQWARTASDNNDDPLGDEITSTHDVVQRGDVILVDKRKKSPPDAKHPRYLLRQLPEVNGGLIAIDAHNGNILAMSGGYSWTLSKFNRATQAKRQPGSAFKPFIYLAALDNGFSPTSKVLDAPFVFKQSNEDADWKPQNYSKEFYGLTLLRQGLEKSRNLITLRLANAIGLRPVADFAKKLGVTDNLPTNNLSIALGTHETTLINLTTAYAAFVNGGKKVHPSLISRIQDSQGVTIYKKDPRVCPQCATKAFQSSMRPPYPLPIEEQVIDPPLAYQMVSLLEGVMRRGTGYYVSRTIKHAIAGKTGTTNDHKDAWFIGFSPDIVVGVYVGYDVPRSLGERGTGAGAAGPIFSIFMNEALKEQPIFPFRIPSGVRLVSINRESGLPTDPGSRGAIFEAFRADQLDGSQNNNLDGEGEKRQNLNIADPIVNADPILDSEPLGLY